MNADQGPVQPADPQWRRRVVGLLAAFTAIAAVTILVIEREGPRWAEWLAEDALAGGWRVRAVFAGVAVAVAAPLVALGAYASRLGRRVALGDRFPPEHTPVLRNTLVLTGAAARRRARHLQGLGWGLIGFGLATGAGLWWLLHGLLKHMVP